ncbi:hypothetical protein TWF506_004666 [Arthrobotrys conoides]|uniref:Uncharacterized protein n=1 Tax=Arthrobotrys conoides TaxID=74498 RepID=A0AAN8P3F9_9PEZI
MARHPIALFKQPFRGEITYAGSVFSASIDSSDAESIYDALQQSVEFPNPLIGSGCVYLHIHVVSENAEFSHFGAYPTLEDLERDLCQDEEILKLDDNYSQLSRYGDMADSGTEAEHWSDVEYPTPSSAKACRLPSRYLDFPAAPAELEGCSHQENVNFPNGDNFLAAEPEPYHWIEPSDTFQHDSSSSETGSAPFWLPNPSLEQPHLRFSNEIPGLQNELFRALNLTDTPTLAGELHGSAWGTGSSGMLMPDFGAIQEQQGLAPHFPDIDCFLKYHSSPPNKVESAQDLEEEFGLHRNRAERPHQKFSHMAPPHRDL